MKTIIIGAGSDLGVHVDGAYLGPDKLINNLNKENETISLIQDKNIIKSKNKADKRKNEDEIEKFNTNVYNLLVEKKKQDYFTILLGGDHSVAVPSALASSKVYGDIGIIWFDAHPDYNTFETTETGNIHGLPLAAISGYDNQELRTFHDGSIIKKENTVVVGARSIDKQELDNIKKSGITVFTTEDIKRHGVKKICEEAFKIAGNNTKGIHISYDLDLIDPRFAPGVSVPEINGINKDEALEINKFILKNINNVVSYDLVEFNPLRDIDNKTEKLAMELLTETINSTSKKDSFNEIKI